MEKINANDYYTKLSTLQEKSVPVYQQENDTYEVSRNLRAIMESTEFRINELDNMIDNFTQEREFLHGLKRRIDSALNELGVL